MEPDPGGPIRIPDRLAPLVDQGVIDDVIRPLMSGKEAQIYLVLAKGERRVAKVYKEALQRSFKQRADYTEGRRGRNTRDQRAMARRSRFGRELAEEAWRTAEVDAMHRLNAAGVRVPAVYDFIDGVLVMELIADARGEPAPRIVDVHLSRDEAERLFETLLREVVKMLCAGVVHGDLSDFNVLIGANGPVIIDFPQVVDPAFNRNARKLLIRDVRNLQHFLSRFSHGLRNRQFGEEMWELYEKGVLKPNTPLTGRWRQPSRKADAEALLAEFMAIEKEIRDRRERLGLDPSPRARRPLPRPEPPPEEPPRREASPRPAKAAPPARSGQARPDQPPAAQPRPAEAQSAGGEAKRRRRRRRRKPPGAGTPPTTG